LANIGKIKIPLIVSAIQDKFLVDFRPYLPIRSIDPYTGHVKPAHWWNPTVIAEHFLEHDPHPYTYNTMRLKSSMKLLRDCEDHMRRKDLASDLMVIDRSMFQQRKQLIEEVRMFQSYLNKSSENSSAASSMMAAMNTASAKM
jgi:hypothetical protein